MGRRWSSILILTVGFGLIVISKSQFVPDKPCFCKHLEAVESCPCIPDSIDSFNNDKIFPMLQRLLQKDFFKFYKVSLKILSLIGYIKSF